MYTCARRARDFLRAYHISVIIWGKGATSLLKIGKKKRVYSFLSLLLFEVFRIQVTNYLLDEATAYAHYLELTNTMQPSVSPTKFPTPEFTDCPTFNPSTMPTTGYPSVSPSYFPTSALPTKFPTTEKPTATPVSSIPTTTPSKVSNLRGSILK